jgi:hypothetical protein
MSKIFCSWCIRPDDGVQFKASVMVTAGNEDPVELDSEDTNFTIRPPQVNTIQTLEDSNLVVTFDENLDPSDDPITFSTSWSSDRIDTWVNTLFPEALNWLKVNRPLEDPEQFHWVLLILQGRRLVEFVKQGLGINGKHLETSRGTKSKKSWESYKIYLGACSNLICGERY